jgi:response regulator RpfG family c-di-GMP phosphodiesterase
MAEHHCGLLRLSSQLHDVGKVAIHDSILCKPGRLRIPEQGRVRLAVDNVLAERVSHFDPEVLDAFMAAMPEVEAIRRTYGD